MQWNILQVRVKIFCFFLYAAVLFPKTKWYSLADTDGIARRFICLQTDQTNSLICCFRASCWRLLWQFLWVQPTLLLSCMPSGFPTAPRRGVPCAALRKRAKRIANQQGARRIFLVGGDQTLFRRVQTGVAPTRYDLSLSQVERASSAELGPVF